MIDVKIGNERKTPTQTNTEKNNSENMLAQIKYLRDMLSEHENIQYKQKRYTNIVLTLIFVLLFINTLPTLFKIIAILYSPHIF